MNVIGVFGGKNAEQVDLVYSVIEFCIKRLMPRMKTLDITTYLEGDMENADGYCLAESNRQFILEIDKKLDSDDLITAVCHEMVHVKQYAKKELDINGKVAYNTIEEYLDLWYEKEAYKLQEILLEEFKNVS